jgi:hypothetical protein
MKKVALRNWGRLRPVGRLKGEAAEDYLDLLSTDFQDGCQLAQNWVATSYFGPCPPKEPRRIPTCSL